MISQPFMISLSHVLSLRTGAHLNPAVTMALSLVRRFPWKRLPVYWCAQYMGALAASGTVLGIYHGKYQIPHDFFHVYLNCITFSSRRNFGRKSQRQIPD